MIYFDNAATTWPKPPSVIDAMNHCMRDYAANPGRSGHLMAMTAQDKVYECRELLSEFLSVPDSNNVIFTSNATESLNTVILGILNPGDHVIFTQMEHNSVIRPVFSMRKKITYSIAPADTEGFVSAQAIEQLILPETRLIVMTHVSNVCGTIEPVREVAAIAKEKKLLFLLDASQSCGILPINMTELGIDFLAAPGHKGLYGPMGTGILCINSETVPEPLKYGGTGSYSRHMHQPAELPDHFESGTLNLPGICGLCEGIKYLRRVGTENIFAHEQRLCAYLLGELGQNPKIEICGKQSTDGRTGVVSFVYKEHDCVETAQQLSKRFFIAVRSGYHCAYTAHQALGTEQSGSIRVSLGVFNTISEIKRLLYALEHI